MSLSELYHIINPFWFLDIPFPKIKKITKNFAYFGLHFLNKRKRKFTYNLARGMQKYNSEWYLFGISEKNFYFEINYKIKYSECGRLILYVEIKCFKIEIIFSNSWLSSDFEFWIQNQKQTLKIVLIWLILKIIFHNWI